MKQILKSEKFWALLAALVAAFATFFLSSCSVQGKMLRHGIHIDTVRNEFYYRSNNYKF